MNQYVLFIILIFILFFEVEAQSPPRPPQQIPDNNAPQVGSAFRPSVAVVVGVLGIMFSLTFLLLIYAKFCHGQTSELLLRQNLHEPPGLVRSRSRFSGIDKTVIDSLPFFRFSSLRGSKDGLECAVCLSKFEETETLRLLPKCKHAFHVNCVDKWLESHSSCPLCRLKVDAEDVTIFMYSSSMRFSRTQSDLTDDPNLELFVRREPEDRGSSRFSVGSSFRKIENDIEQGISVHGSANIYGRKYGETLMDNFAPRSLASDVVWSDVRSADLLFLRSDMLDSAAGQGNSSSTLPNAPSTAHLAITLDRSYSLSPYTEANLDRNSRFLIPTEKRSMSEIVNLSRFVDHFGLKNTSKESPSDASSTREENMRRLWSPIARRTVEWFAGRERSKQSQYSRQLSIV